MATPAENLTTRRDAVAAELASLTLDGPDFSIDGVSMSVTEYAAQLIDQITKLNQAIAVLTGPTIAYSRGR